MCDPLPAVLDAHELHAREAVEHPVADGRGERVLDGAAAVGDVGERLGPEGDVLAARALPGVDVVLVAAVGGVQGDHHSGLLDPGPERVELGQERRPRPPQAGHRRGPHEDGPGAPVQHPLELGDALVEHARAHDRRAEDAALVVVAPLVVEPVVEGPDGHDGEVGVVLETLLHQARQRREHETGVHTLFVEQGQPVGRVAERRDGAHRLAGELPQRLPLRVLGRVEGHVGTRSGHHLEGGVRDELGDGVADHELLAPVDLRRTGTGSCGPTGGGG